ncbi:MAG: CopG family transcriptional regulator [Acidobacteriota bacterium]
MDELDQKLDRSRDALVNQAIDDFLLQQALILEKIKPGLESADRGELIPHQEVFDRLKSRIQQF